MSKGVKNISTNLLLSAVLNNAEWCELVAKSHGLHNQWQKKAWHTTGTMPPFYPNAVSTQPGISDETVFRIASNLPMNCGWKDSFAELELGKFGFSTLFEADWLALLNVHSRKTLIQPASFVTSTDELAEWITAWGETPAGLTVFLPNFVGPKVKFVYCKTAGTINAGLIANHSNDCVGISNRFGHSTAIAECVRLASEWAQGVPLVCYSTVDGLKEMQEIDVIKLGKYKSMGEIDTYILLFEHIQCAWTDNLRVANIAPDQRVHVEEMLSGDTRKHLD